jgi:hypothetical protein
MGSFAVFLIQLKAQGQRGNAAAIATLSRVSLSSTIASPLGSFRRSKNRR